MYQEVMIVNLTIKQLEEATGLADFYALNPVYPSVPTAIRINEKAYVKQDMLRNEVHHYCYQVANLLINVTNYNN